MRKNFLLWMGESGRGDRYLGHSSRHTQVPVPVTIPNPASAPSPTASENK